MPDLANVRQDVGAAAQRLIQLVQEAGGHATITSGYRSYAQQAKLYRRYQQGQSHYPAAPPGTSKHEIGLAVDIVIQPESWQAAAGQWWESIGGVWGGRFGDPIHFEV